VRETERKKKRENVQAVARPGRHPSGGKKGRGIVHLMSEKKNKKWSGKGKRKQTVVKNGGKA